MAFSLDHIVSCQEEWRRNLPSVKADMYIALSRDIMIDIIHNNNEFPNPMEVSCHYGSDVIYHVFRDITKRNIKSIEHRKENSTIVTLK